MHYGATIVHILPPGFSFQQERIELVLQSPLESLGWVVLDACLAHVSIHNHPSPVKITNCNPIHWSIQVETGRGQQEQ